MEIPMKRFGGKNKEIELSSNCEAGVIQVRKSHCPPSPSTLLQSPSIKWFDLVPLKKGKSSDQISLFSRVQLCAILWTAACQAPLSMGFARQESWRGFPGLTLGDLPNPGTEPTSLTSTCTGQQVLYH